MSVILNTFNLMSKSIFVTVKGDELSQEQATQQLLSRVTALEEQIKLNTKVLREILNQLQNND